MRSFRSLAILAVLFAGLVAYLYFVDAKKPVEEATEQKPKVFTGADADKIEQLKISTIAGGVAELQKTSDGWKLTSPSAARADESEVTSQGSRSHRRDTTAQIRRARRAIRARCSTEEITRSDDQ